jgi:hypothetical protein
MTIVSDALDADVLLDQHIGPRVCALCRSALTSQQYMAWTLRGDLVVRFCARCACELSSGSSFRGLVADLEALVAGRREEVREALRKHADERGADEARALTRGAGHAESVDDMSPTEFEEVLAACRAAAKVVQLPTRIPERAEVLAALRAHRDAHGTKRTQALMRRVAGASHSSEIEPRHHRAIVRACDDELT